MSNLLTILKNKRIPHTVSDNGHITVSGDLDLMGTDITELPAGLNVGGGLDLRGTGITELPAGLNVGGWLDLEGTGITELPAGLTVGGGLNLEGTGITALPDDFSCDSLYLNPEKISNIAYRTNCGNSSRTIFAVWTQNNYRIAAGCFFGTVDEFEAAVDRSYHGSAAETYKQKARECVNELTEKLNNWQ